MASPRKLLLVLATLGTTAGAIVGLYGGAAAQAADSQVDHTTSVDGSGIEGAIGGLLGGGGRADGFDGTPIGGLLGGGGRADGFDGTPIGGLLGGGGRADGFDGTPIGGLLGGGG